MTVRQSRILVFFGASYRTTRAAGPFVSLRNMIDALASVFEFRVVSRTLLQKESKGLLQALRELASGKFDLVYLNSFHDVQYTIPLLVLRRLGFFRCYPFLIACRGEFSAQARKVKPRRKRLYRAILAKTGMLNRVSFHFTSEAEERDFVDVMGSASDRYVAANITSMPLFSCYEDARTVGCRLAFVGRVSPIKNLDIAIRALNYVSAPVTLHIYGFVESEDYLVRCLAGLDRSRTHIRVAYEGELAPEAVHAVWQTADLLFLPSRSENFGHAIFEALSHGVPALIGDNTPWRDLEVREAGFDLSVDDEMAFARKIDAFAALDAAARHRFRLGARRCAQAWVDEAAAVDTTRRMFEAVLCKMSDRQLKSGCAA